MSRGSMMSAFFALYHYIHEKELRLVCLLSRNGKLVQA
jgi:hypothetical protein